MERLRVRTKLAEGRWETLSGLVAERVNPQRTLNRQSFARVEMDDGPAPAEIFEALHKGETGGRSNGN